MRFTGIAAIDSAKETEIGVSSVARTLQHLALEDFEKQRAGARLKIQHRQNILDRSSLIFQPL